MTSGFSRFFEFFKPQKKEFTSSETQFSFPQEKFNQLEKMIGTTIGNKKIYVEALIHRSFLEENEQFSFSNERLEFLGDSVLNLIIGEYLFNKFPNEEEGFLTKVRAKLVNRNALSLVAEDMDLAELLILSSSLPKSITHNSKSMLSDALEALIGAIYLDKGIETCKQFIQKKILEPALKNGDHLIDENYKSQLLEYAQANKLAIPVYQIVSEDGPHHDKTFTAEVIIGEKVLGEGKGKSKKEAEQNAAQVALKRI
ncbi:MAG: Ribonuclease 3 [Ignavibacteriaceae bacterium]|nr:MAG: ribonuclease III [Chlorobiota bacterium]MBL1121369.1 ribonuclease III [Ignavibacteriota bacterium]MBV6419648.1 Ribonuclease 3 [Ignavibacteriaceae bacterium]MCE7855203.1 ribonuclease III [Ignavibacteria bacterium CHB3]MCZ7613452.1 ribonuclease III [Ignavibacteriaceae bacterium]